MLTFILGASLTLNLGLIFLAWQQEKNIEEAQHIIQSFVAGDTEDADSNSQDQSDSQ